MTQAAEVLTCLSPELRARLVESTNLRLLKIVRDNLITRYATESTSLAALRDAISAHGTDSDAELSKDFHKNVFLSDYEPYKPFIDKFKEVPCKESEVVDLLAPGLPKFFFISSGTSGKDLKILPMYHPHDLQQVPLFYERKGPLSLIFHYGIMELKEIVRDDDLSQVVTRVPMCIGTSAMNRSVFGWEVEDDDKRMGSIIPGHVTPWAVSMMINHRSYMMLHALFTLACRDLDSISTSFTTMFFDFVRYMDEEWDLFVSSIRDGTVPALEGADEIRPFLEAHLHADPERAEELLRIGRPLSCEGWAALAWPNLRQVTIVCSGSFVTTLPKVKKILGPTITLRNPGYTASEATMADGYADSVDLLILQCRDHIEFLDVTVDESHEKLCQVYELEPGKQYEVVLTTRQGLWRYRVGDVIEMVGFHSENGQPIFKYLSRRSLALRLHAIVITDAQLVAAVQAIDPDVISVHEFIAVMDDRRSPLAVGLLVELGDTGPNSHLAPRKFFDGLDATNIKYKEELDIGKTGYPTVGLLQSGTFTEYPQWRASKMNVASTQVKVPAITLHDASREWLLKKVIQEL